MNTPFSPLSSAPRSRNSMANSVLPQPALPQTSVGPPRGRPPSVTSSRPSMPVGVFGRVPATAAFFAGRASDLPIQEDFSSPKEAEFYRRQMHEATVGRWHHFKQPG